MRAAIICFTTRGAETAVRIRGILEEKETLRGEKGLETESFLENEIQPVRVWCAKSDYVSSTSGELQFGDEHTNISPDARRIEPMQKMLREWTREAFAEHDALVFVGATGIAVRSIAPFLKSKTSDPAVLCVDELGTFVIPLVSGHIGGANELAVQLAKGLGAIPVVTTATDLNGRFAVDMFAKKNGLWISDMKLAKQISADVLDEKRIGFVSDFPILGKAPEELEIWDIQAQNAYMRDRQEKSAQEQKAQIRNVQEQDTRECRSREYRSWGYTACDIGICVTLDEAKRPFRQTLTLIPRIVSIGVGCRKNTDPVLIEEKICAVLRSCGVSMRSVERIASIDLKAQEPGLIAFARKYGLEFVTYTAQELREAPGKFDESVFVESVTGVSNVCERSAVLASSGRSAQRQSDTQIDEHGCGNKLVSGSCDARTDENDRCGVPMSGGRLIQEKTAGDGVTVALAVRDWSVEFG